MSVGTTRLLSRSEVAEILNVKEQTLANWITTGRYALKCVKVGRLARYRPEDVEKFIEERTIGGEASGDER